MRALTAVNPHTDFLSQSLSLIYRQMQKKKKKEDKKKEKN